MITQEILKDQLDYCKDSGVFIWKVKKGGLAQVGAIAGSIDSKGYRQIRLCRKSYLAHRLAWLYVYGEMPKSDIDHIDRNPKNNSINNLRLCTHSENHQNVGLRSSNSSGYSGVFQVKRNLKWIAYININKKRVTLGTFETKEDAIEARKKGKEKYHTFGAQHNVKFKG